MKREYPTIWYGRRALGSNADYYDVLSKSPDFPDDAETLFRQQVCQSIEWTCGDHGNETYSDSVLFWKLSAGRILVARLTDAGCDSLGRPHAISIEACVVETDNVDMPMAEFLVGFVNMSDDNRHVENIERYIKSDAVSLLLASHPNFHVSGIDLICSPERTVTTNRPKPVPPVVTTQPSNPYMKAFDPKEKDVSKSLVVLFIFLLLCAVAMLGGLLYYSHSKLATANSALVEMNKYLEEMEDKLGEANRHKEWVEKHLKDKESALQTAEGEAGRLRSLLDTSSSDRERTLRQFNQQYEETLGKIFDIVKDQLHEGEQ
ncbi:MAG: hypothetical protein FWE95_01610 [Planctomycetaceae bacterium]|nr:hypothetical protein [Planctomycetaceae bacterium]